MTEFKVYITDTDGSERLGTTVFAKSKGHALSIARKRGLRKITSVEIVEKTVDIKSK